MASAASNDPGNTATMSTPAEPTPVPSSTEPHSIQIQQQTDQLPSSTPVEMTNLMSQPSDQPDSLSQTQSNTQTQPSNTQPSQSNLDATSALQQPQPAYIPASRPSRARQDSEAIGPPAEDSATASTYLHQNTSLDAGPAVLITLILLNGARHPYKIDQRYLRKRNVVNESENIDPYSISVYTMKELIWRDWREEWVPRPTIPGAIRLIFFGKLLDDKQTLSDCRLQPNTANAVHMTVRPQEFIDDDEHSKGGKLGPSRMGRIDDSDAEAGCRCCAVM